MDANFEDAHSEESWRKNSITNNLKIKRNTPYPILLIEASLSPIRELLTIYLLDKNKLKNKEDEKTS
jgi:hypothetical protein